MIKGHPNHFQLFATTTIRRREKSRKKIFPDRDIRSLRWSLEKGEETDTPRFVES
uniref:Uncharacterized protein n=1 Tax=Schistosoma haematobium TaxID=6185 RepID=A0A094ZTR0_SCHHA